MGELEFRIFWERVPYPCRERMFIVLGLLLTNIISSGKATELLDLRIK